MVRWKGISVFVLMAFAVQLNAHAACPSRQETETFSTKKNFYTATTPGTIALMPNVRTKESASIENKYIAFRKPGTYEVRRDLASSSKWWMVINHRKQLGPPSYVGLLIAKFFEYPLKMPLELVRIGNWHRPQDDVPIPLQEQFVALQKFMELQEEDASLESFDEKFGKWHAIPEGGDTLSWKQRIEWQMEIDQIIDSMRDVANWKEEEIHVLLQARLLRYEMTDRWNTQNPVIWDINTDGPKAIFIKTFSPAGSEFVRQYCIVFTD